MWHCRGKILRNLKVFYRIHKTRIFFFFPHIVAAWLKSAPCLKLPFPDVANILRFKKPPIFIPYFWLQFADLMKET